MRAIYIFLLLFIFPEILAQNMERPVPEWLKDAVVYQVYPGI